jgi:hypothetical protein
MMMMMMMVVVVVSTNRSTGESRNLLVTCISVISLPTRSIGTEA